MASSKQTANATPKRVKAVKKKSTYGVLTKPALKRVARRAGLKTVAEDTRDDGRCASKLLEIGPP